ncbi:ankyrin repeat protein [Aspergillus udagawae]|nr:ankyrin repeat protein [Aspergillus udagawae]
MSLLTLPSELLLYIAASLPCAKDILSFVLVSRTTSALLLSSLYRFNIQYQNSSALHWAARHGKLHVAEVMLRHYQPDVNAVYHTCTPLVYAHESVSIVKALLAHPEISVNYQNKQGQCALWCAALQGFTEIVEDLLQRPDIQVDLPEIAYCLTPLAAAVAKGRTPIVQQLIQTGRVNVNAPDLSRRTPIFHAIARQDSAILEILLAHDRLHLSWQDDLGNTPLICSVLKGQTVLTKMLLGHPYPHVDIRDPANRTALWHAVHQGDEELVQLLLDSGSDIHARDIEGVAPLHLSIRQANVSMVQKLLRYSRRDHSTATPGVNHGISAEPPPLCLATSQGSVDIWMPKGRTPLHLAAENGDRSVVQVLLNHTDIDLHARDEWESTALHEAAKRGHLAVVKLILAEPSIDVNAKDRNDATPLWWATRRNHNRVAARLLAEPNADVNAVGQFERPLPDRSTSLHHAVQGRATLIVRLLLMEKGLNPNVVDLQGWTPLGRAALQGDVRTVELLLTRRDIQVNATMQSEQPPLWLAARHGHIRVVRRLLQCRDIDINQGWGGYVPPLLAAIIAGHTEVAKTLLACGERLNINAQTYQKESALSLAARYGHLQVVDTILQDRRADCNRLDDERRTALWWAAHEGQTAVVRRLLEDADVQVDIKDRQGTDALEAARSQHHLGVIGLLQAYRVGHRRDNILQV